MAHLVRVSVVIHVKPVASGIVILHVQIGVQVIVQINVQNSVRDIVQIIAVENAAICVPQIVQILVR